VNTRQSPVGVQGIRGRRRLVVIALVCLLVTACSGSGSDNLPPPEISAPAATVARDYWPTDGWRIAAPNDHGMDPTVLAQVDDQVAAAYPQVRSVLVVRHGYLVYERYCHGLAKTSGHDVRSVTKSIIGALVGIAIAEGKIKSLDQSVGELLPAQRSADADPRLAHVTVKQLLTMTSGLASDDDSVGGDLEMTTAMEGSSDWVRHILSRRLESEPGDHFAYSNASSHLLSAIVANASGQSTLAYARAKLFDPLGIRTDGIFQPVVSDPIAPKVLKAYEQASVAWPVDPRGYHLGYSALKLPARDLAKFGFLYLNGGRWEDGQLIPPGYVAAATSPNGSSPNLNMGYGWHWWVAVEGDHRTFSARGYGGQFVYVVPDLDLVAVITSEPETSGVDPKILITRTIVPAVRS
jgi:CubicO group peptidase (beta-lactamase class C family)